MKALSIRQPWAWLIAAGHKDIENRTWATSLRGRVYIHAGRTIDSDYLCDIASGLTDIDQDLRRKMLDMNGWVVGAIIGEVDIVDCVVRSASPWFAGPFGFVLSNSLLYDIPIPFKGRLGLFEVKLTNTSGNIQKVLWKAGN